MANPFSKMGDIGALMKQANKAMEESKRIEAELEETMIEGQAGGGMVKVVVNGKCDVQSVKIDKSAVDPADVETLEDLVTLAVRDAIVKANTNREEKLKAILPPGLPGGFGF